MRVVVTRPADQAAPLVAALEAAGHEAVLCPLIRIEPLGDGPIDTGGYDWVVLTSPNGAREFARRRAGELPSVAAIGPGTAAALAEAGIRADLVSELSTQEGLAAAFPLRPRHALVAAAEGARRVLVDELDADFLPLYRTVELRPEDPPSGDVAVLASSSAARAWAALGLSVPVVSIGPQTTEAARAAGLDVAAEAERPDVEAIVEAISSLPASCRPSSPS